METLPYAGIPIDTVKRIVEAANALYEESGRSTFPNVDAVRRRARVNMNDASAAMRSWRREQSRTAAPLTVTVPAPVNAACHTLLVAVWKEATDLANANLQAAQQGWEMERAEAESCRAQLATAFDQQSTELTEAQRMVGVLQAEMANQQAQLQEVEQANETCTKELQQVRARAVLAEARIADIEKRAADLKTELTAFHSDAREERREAQRKLAAAEQALAERAQVAQQREHAYATAREELAHVRGQLEALTGQASQGSAARATNGRKQTKAVVE